MSLLEIHVLGSPVLRTETVPVSVITEDLRKLVEDMFDTMRAAQGIGLAAPQVGRLERVAIIDIENDPIVLINPEIISETGKERAEEGCLSIPDIYGDVDRAARVTVRATDLEGNLFEREATELLARAFQHEIDHLHGKLFIDYLSFLKRRGVMARWEDLKEKYPGQRRVLSPTTVTADGNDGGEKR
ncbi:MAG TPA: peptide deformylase [Gemmatimonadaceae bacterium]|nr:peptide deformylase [Gemmatimonadaceae bacterium]